MKIEIVPVWQQMTPELLEELAVFWQQNKAIANPAMAKARAEQAVCLGRDEAGAICGVSTAVIKVLPRLRQPMYYYRQYFAESMRGKHQVQPFFAASKRALQDYTTQQSQPESLGILLELENSKLVAAYTKAHEPAFDATFIGYSPRGLQLRVSYFEDAMLQAPTPLRAPAAVSGTRRPAGTRPAPSNPRHGNVRS